MNDIVLFYHGGSKNHGCEAIVRSSKRILNFKTNISLFSFRTEEDIKYGLDADILVKPDLYNKIEVGSLQYYIAAIYHKLTRSDYRYTVLSHRDFFKYIKKGDIYISIGGDNYCYRGQDVLGHYNREVHKKRAKTVLWGCSVEPDLLNDKHIAKDISRYDLITARESISYNALKEVNSNTVLVSDPAFVLNKVDLPLPNNWKEGNTIGINVSPLVMDSSNNPELVYESFVNLINYIIDNTDCNIALIPHVVWESNDDRKVLNKLYERFVDTNRIAMIPDHNCMELKGYISRCRFFVGARTHATIAAYSSCVPTLVLGYSIKSIGIAKDLFGTSDNYVLPVQSLSDTMELVDSFKWLMDNENKIKNHLNKIMPEYKERAYIGKKAIENLFSK